jgi:hypothetical protein
VNGWQNHWQKPGLKLGLFQVFVVLPVANDQVGRAQIDLELGDLVALLTAVLGRQKKQPPGETKAVRVSPFWVMQVQENCSSPGMQEVDRLGGAPGAAVFTPTHSSHSPPSRLRQVHD